MRHEVITAEEIPAVRDQLARVLELAFATTDRPSNGQDALDVIDWIREKNPILDLAYDGEQLVGFCNTFRFTAEYIERYGFLEVPNPPRAGEPFLSFTAVLPEKMNLGIANELVRHALDRLGNVRVWARTWPANEKVWKAASDHGWEHYPIRGGTQICSVLPAK